MEEFIICLIVAALAGLLFCLGYDAAVGNMREETVKRGYSEWVFVDDNGTKEFRWIPLQTNVLTTVAE